MKGLDKGTPRGGARATSSSRAARETVGSEVRAVAAVLHVTSAAHRKLAARVRDGGFDFTITASDGSLSVRAQLSLEDVAAGEENLGEDVVINWATRAIRKGANQITLSRTELRIMGTLLELPGRLTSRREISNAIWPRHNPDDPSIRRAVHTYICALRKRLRSIGLGSALQTVRGSGCRLVL